MNDTLANILIALIVPVGWGLFSAWLFDHWRARRQQDRQGGDSHRDSDSAQAAHSC